MVTSITCFLITLPLPPPTVSYPLSLHDALPIFRGPIGGKEGLALADKGRHVTRRPADRRLELRQRISIFAFGQLKDRKSTRLNSSHLVISYAVFCLKKKIIQSERAFTV